MKNNERIILILLAALNFTHIMDFMIMMPLGNYLIPYFNITAKQFSFVVASYTFSAGISGFAAAFFVDRFDRKKVLMTGFIGFLVGTFCCAIAPTYGLLVAARILAGMFGGLIAAQVLSIVADLIPYERRAAAMGIIMSAFSLASIFGVPFGLYLAKHISWHAPFYFIAIFGVLIVPLIIRYIPRMDKHLTDVSMVRESPLVVMKEVAKNRQQRLALSLSATLNLGHFLIIPFLNPFMEFNMGFSKQETPMVYLVGGALTLVSSPIIGRMADKAGKYKLFSYLLLLSLFPIAFITNMPHVPFYLVLCVTGFWFIVSSGRAIPAQAMISNVVPPQKRGSFMSFNSSIQLMAVGLASIIVGYVVVVRADTHQVEHYNITGYLSIAIILSCLLFAYLLDKAMAIIAKQPAVEQAVPLKVIEEEPATV